MEDQLTQFVAFLRDELKNVIEANLVDNFELFCDCYSFDVGMARKNETDVITEWVGETYKYEDTKVELVEKAFKYACHTPAIFGKGIKIQICP